MSEFIEDLLFLLREVAIFTILVIVFTFLIFLASKLA